MQKNPDDYEATGGADVSGLTLEDELKKAEAHVRRFIQARPLTTILGAAVLGFIVARILREDRA